METEPSLYEAILAARRADQRQCCVYLKKRLLIFYAGITVKTPESHFARSQGHVALNL